MIWILTRFSLFAIFHAIFPRGYCRSPIDLKCPQANGDLLNVGELDLVHLQSLYTDNGSMIYTFCWPIVLDCFSSWNFEFSIGMSVYQSQKSDWQTTFWWQVSIGFHHFTSQSVDEVISNQLMHKACWTWKTITMTFQPPWWFRIRNRKPWMGEDLPLTFW